MSALDAKFAAVAFKLLAKFGKPVMYETTKPDVYDPATGRAGILVTSTPVNGYVSRSTMDGSPLEHNEVEVLIAGSVINATQNDRLTIDGMVYAVNTNRPIYSGNNIALHVLTARQT